MIPTCKVWLWWYTKCCNGRYFSRLNSIGNIYSVAISDFPFNADLGLYYQYYRLQTKKWSTIQRDLFQFKTKYTGDEQPLAERRYIPFTGATDGGTADVNDNVSSTVDERRQPTFRNTDPIGQAMTVTYTVDVRPAYYQIMSGDVLNDIVFSIILFLVLALSIPYLAKKKILMKISSFS